MEIERDVLRFDKRNLSTRKLNASASLALTIENTMDRDTPWLEPIGSIQRSPLRVKCRRTAPCAALETVFPDSSPDENSKARPLARFEATERV